jgi:phosphatidylglycerophosphatase B
MLPALSLLAMSYFEPTLDPFIPPHIDLTGDVAVCAYWLAESGGTYGIPLIGTGLTALLLSRRGVAAARRAFEITLIVSTLTLLLGCGASVNEHLVKPWFAIARPNIIELAGTPSQTPRLQMSIEAFYQLPDKQRRSQHLQTVLAACDWLNPSVRDHWIAETGYSFPSGHSFSAMLFATFFLAMALAYASQPRLWVFYLLVPWAVGVCFSRLILRVHSPTDICVGGSEGLVMGLIAFLLVRKALGLAASPVRGEPNGPGTAPDSSVATVSLPGVPPGGM